MCTSQSSRTETIDQHVSPAIATFPLAAVIQTFTWLTCIGEFLQPVKPYYVDANGNILQYCVSYVFPCFLVAAVIQHICLFVTTAETSRLY